MTTSFAAAASGSGSGSGSGSVSGSGSGLGPDAEHIGVTVYSFRPRPHAHRDDASARHVALPHAEPSGWYLVKQMLFLMIMVHYFLWFIVCCGVVLLFGSVHYGLGVAIVLLYLPSFFNGDQFKGHGRPWDWGRKHSIWHSFQDYLQLEVVRITPLDPSKQYIFAAYPHGIFILSRVTSYGGLWERMFPGIDFRVLGASPMFYIPCCREPCLWMNAIDAAKNTAIEALTKYNKSLIIYPGGSAEIFATDGNSTDTTLIVRKGFIKLALQQGVDVVPAFVFGEKWLYSRRFLPRPIHNFFMSALRTPLILFWGRWFTWLPRRLPLAKVFGSPIKCEKTEHPTPEQIDAIWDKYESQLQSIFDTYKGVYGYGPDEKLVFRHAHHGKGKGKYKAEEATI